MKILYLGESWLGSCARSMREALARRNDIELDDINEDAWFPRPTTTWLKIVNRATERAYQHELSRFILDRVQKQRPDIFITYKGYHVQPRLLTALRDLRIPTVNIYPDWSPHAYGRAHREAVGQYDMVISSKQFHPDRWLEVYGYQNLCVFVPQGYDAKLHLMPEPPAQQPFDVVLIASYRDQYAELVLELAREIGGHEISVALGGQGWGKLMPELPGHWQYLGDAKGRFYSTALRLGKICIAPLQPETMVNGKLQSGDVDTTRTYELAAARCFFIHRRTRYVGMLYDEDTEVPMFDDVPELVSQIKHYLPRPCERDLMARAAHARAVPAYSLDRRAEAIVAHLVELSSGIARRRETDGQIRA